VTTPTGPDFATYDSAGGTGLRPYTGFGAAYVTTIASLTATTQNLNLSSNDSIANAVGPLSPTALVINALVVSGAVNLTIPTGSTLTITSGAILVASGSLTLSGGGTLILGSEGIVMTASGTTATFNDPLNLTGASNLTFSGSGTVNLAAANIVGTGSTALNGGTLVLQAAPVLGTGSFLLTSGTLQTTLASGYLLPNAVFNNASATLGATAAAPTVNNFPILFGGTAALNGTNNTLTVNGTAIAAIDGIASGTGALIKAGNGTLALAGTNTYTGFLFVNGGIVQGQNSAFLGGTQAYVSAGADRAQRQRPDRHRRPGKPHRRHGQLRERPRHLEHHQLHRR
jgi:autotransporter-associated beta strand protein